MRYVAVTRGFAYPTGESLARVRAAGGFPNMTPDERAAVTFKVVSVGQDCSDMPAESLAHYLQRGDVALVDEVHEHADDSIVRKVSEG